MRSVLLLAALALVPSRVAGACGEPAFEQHALDRSQLDDRVKPGPVAISMWIEEAGGGGCVGPNSTCNPPPGRRLVVHVNASDDQTPPDKLGYRVTITAGRAPFVAPGDIRPDRDDLLAFDLGETEELDFELAIRAVDLNGNIGPATYTQVAQSASGGCASHRAGRAMSFGLIGIALAFLVARRRRR
jgi:hypothetical protein